MDVIYCAGGNSKLARIAIEEGFLYGARSDDIRRGLRCNGLIDINWSDFDWPSHVARVREHSPKYAVAPDVMNSDELLATLTRADALQPYCERVIVVPKVVGIVQQIPGSLVVGISVPTSYAGFLPPVQELIGREVHLLGGSPPQQKQLWRYYETMGVSVVGVDTNAHSKASDYGSYWDGYRWRDDERISIGKYGAFRKSCKGIMAMWQSLGALAVASHVPYPLP